MNAFRIRNLARALRDRCRQWFEARSVLPGPEFERALFESEPGAAPASPWTRRLRGQVCASLGGAYARLGAWNTVRALGSATVTADPTNARGWDLVADSCSAGGPRGVILRPFVGLVEGRRHDANGAAAARAAAVAVQPTARRWHLLGAALELTGGDAQPAFEAACSMPDASADEWYGFGRHWAAVAARGGGYDRRLFTEHERCMRRALDLEPRHGSARYHLIRVAIRAQAWEAAVDGAMPSSPRSSSRVRELLMEPPFELLQAVADTFSREGRLAPADLWLVVHWRLHSLGQLSDAFAAKDRYAATLLAAPRHRQGSLHAVTTAAKALVCLDRSDEALDHVEHALRGPLPSYDRAALAKLRGDINLGLGRLDDCYFDQLITTPTSAGETRFRDLVRARRVAIVGPTSGEPDAGAEIDGFDVVIRPKFTATSPPAAAVHGSRTDIAYFNDVGAQLLGRDIEATLDSHALRLAVFRPTAWQHAPGHLAERGDVRFAPSENDSLLDASSFAIQRIIYDVLRYRPREVRVFNVDYYTGVTPYHESYHVDRQLFDERALLPNLAGYGHDLRADYRLARRLLQASVLSASDGVENVLDLDESRYLTTVRSAAVNSARSNLDNSA